MHDMFSHHKLKYAGRLVPSGILPYLITHSVWIPHRFSLPSSVTTLIHRYIHRMCTGSDALLYDCTNIKKTESINFPKNVNVEELGLIDM